MLPKLLANQPKVYCALGQDPVWDTRLTGWINQVREQVRSGISAPTEICDSRFLLDEMRLFKSAEELQVMRRAAEISTGAEIPLRTWSSSETCAKAMSGNRRREC